MTDERPPTVRRLKLSKYLCRFGWHPDAAAQPHLLVAHPFLGTRASLASDVVGVLDLFGAEPVSLASVQSRLNVPHDVTSSVVAYLMQQGFVIPEDVDEEEIFLRGFREEDAAAHIIESARREYHINESLTLDHFADTRRGRHASEDLRILILGGCLTQFAADELEKIGPGRGFHVRVVTGWPDMCPDVASIDPQLVVLQLSTTWMLGPIWDELPFLDDDEIARRIDTMCGAIDAGLDAILPSCGNRLLLVHNFSAPHTSPLGVAEFRRTHTFPGIVHQLNQYVAQRLRRNVNALIVDEERLTSAIGKLRLWDDAVVAYSHHAPVDFHCGAGVSGLSRFEAFDVRRPNHLARTFAAHYLDLFEVWRGVDRIKCVVVDLDETLWPGVIADEDFTFDSDVMFQSLKYGWHGGLHQALKIVKSRGILLATCSKNDRDDVLGRWEELERYADSDGLGHVLRHDDFVAHEINWKRKPDNIRAIMHRLGFSENAMAFIDNEPVERAEVKSSLPEVLVLGDVPNLIRYELLTNPAFQVNVDTDEARRRTETTAAQLTRDEMRRSVTDVNAFLRTLQIELRIRRVNAGDRLERIVDLIQRTNQFNTRSVRHDIDAVQKYAADPPAVVYTLSVKDRFADYGLVGVLILVAGFVDTFVLSCRVIGLRAAVPFLVEAIRRNPHRLPIVGEVVCTSRNEPCRSVFRDAGFTKHGDAYELHEINRLAVPPPGVFQIVE